MVLLANTFTQTDSDLFSHSVIGMCGISLWISNMTPPPSRVLSFLYTLYGKVSVNAHDKTRIFHGFTEITEIIKKMSIVYLFIFILFV